MSHGRPWTSDDTAWLRRLARSGLTDLEISELMERDHTVVRKKRRDFNIAPGMPRHFRDMLARINMRRRRRAAANSG